VDDRRGPFLPAPLRPEFYSPAAGAPGQPMSPTAPAPAPAPAKKSNTLVIVLCVIFGLLFLLLASCVGTCMYVGKKAKDYAKDSQKNPQITALSTIAAFTPDIEVVSKYLDAGTIVLKNKKTGEITKLSARDFSTDRVASVIDKIKQGKPMTSSVSAESTTRAPEPTTEAAPAESTSSTPSVEEPTSAAQSAAQTAAIKSFPKDFPVYDGSAVKTTEASQNTFAGVSSNTHTFSTSDSPDEVAEFYGKKLGADGYTVMASENSSNENGSKLTRLFQKAGLGSTVNIEVEVQNGKTHVQVNQVLLKQK
jgi:hypothetical protein